MATVVYTVFERQVLALLNVLKSDSATTAEANYVLATALTVTEINDPAFPPAFVRDLIVEAAGQVIRFVCLTEGHPRRADYRTTASIAHAGVLPSAIAYGRVSHTGTGQEMYPVDSPNQINDVLADTGSANSAVFYEYSFSGDTMLLSQTPATLEYFTYTRPAATPAALAALFDGTATVTMGPEFVPVVVNYAVGMGCLKTGSYLDQGSAHLALAERLLTQLGVRVEPADFFKSQSI